MSISYPPSARGAGSAAATAANHPLRRRLAGLRRRLRIVAASRTACWLICWAVAVFLAVGLLDQRFHLPGLVRAFALVGLLSGVGLLLYRYLIEPLAGPVDDLSLALRIEDRYPLLNDALATTVEFLDRSTGPAGESASLRGEAIRRTLARLDAIDFNAVVDNRGLRAAVPLAGLMLLTGLVLTSLFPLLTATAATRLLLPFAAVEWPKKTRLELNRVLTRIGRNKEYRLQGRVVGVIPDEVLLEVQHDGFPPQRRGFAVHPHDHTFTVHLKPEEVQRNFHFRLRANDAVSDEYAVEVLPLPTLIPLNGQPSPQVRIDQPAYTDLPTPQALAPGIGNVELTAGSVVTLRAACDRPLRRARIEYQPEVQGTVQAAALAALGIEHPLGALAAVVLGQAMTAPIPARLGPDPRHLEVTFHPAINGNYVLHFEDENELENSRTYELRLRLDTPPVVRLERPAPSRDVLAVLATAELPLHVVVEDSPFAIRSARLEYRTRPGEEPRLLPLFDATAGVARDLLPFAGLAPLAAPTPRLRLPRLEFIRRFSLRSLRHADGTPLREGDTVTLQASADDFDTVSPGKGPGRSHEVTLRIVGRDALEADLNREQGRVQKELVLLRDKQREALGKVKEIDQRLRQGGKLLPEREAAAAEAAAQQAQQEAAAEQDKADRADDAAARRDHRERTRALKEKGQELDAMAQELKRQATQLPEAAQLQQQIRERVGNDREGLRADLERIRETLRQNGMEHSNGMERMSAIARELNRLAEQEMEQIEPRLTNARKLAELEDERTRQERRAELESRARQAEEDARKAEERERSLNEQAAAVDREAAAASDDRQRDRRAEESKQLRLQAQEQRQRAAERRGDAERDRREAIEAPDPQRARQSLVEARRGQEEVEKTLNALLQDLEPWSSTLDVTGEASRLAREQKELMGQLEELEKKGLTGKNREELAELEKAELDAARDTQRRLQERTDQLLKQMKRLAEERAEKDPETAGDLKRAAEQAEENNLVGQMRAAGEHLRGNELNQARHKQREALAELEKLQRQLRDSREARLDRLSRKTREAEARVEALLDEQEKLQRKIREAGKLADPAERDRELQRLARRQRELQQQAGELAQQLSRLGNERGRQSLQEAADEMGEAHKQLSRGQRDDLKQEDVLDRLDEARRELDEARRRAEEELGREQLVRVGDLLRRLRERQQGHEEETNRIQKAALERKGWSRALKASLRDLGQNQGELGKEAVVLGKRELSGAPVFARLLEMAARAMDRAAERLAGMVRDTPALDRLPDSAVNRDQREALRRLDQLLATLKEAQEEPRPLSRGGDGDKGEPSTEAAGGPPRDDSLPPLAQMRLLRSLQNEVNERTEAFRQKHPDPARHGEAEKKELQDLRSEQKEVADLLERLTRPPGERNDPAALEPEEEGKP